MRAVLVGGYRCKRNKHKDAMDKREGKGGEKEAFPDEALLRVRVRLRSERASSICWRLESLAAESCNCCRGQDGRATADCLSLLAGVSFCLPSAD